MWLESVLLVRLMSLDGDHLDGGTYALLIRIRGGSTMLLVKKLEVETRHHFGMKLG
jgi:hypothetical protein